jgi:hypothetical protein
MLRKVHRAGLALRRLWRGQVRGQGVRRLARVRSAMQLEPSSVSDVAVVTCDQEFAFVMFPRWNIEAADERHGESAGSEISPELPLRP